MQSPFGEIRVLDAHAHFFSAPFFRQLAAASEPRRPPEEAYEALARRLGWELPSPDPLALGRRWVDEMDRHGVERMVLIASVPGDEDSIAAAATAFPDRILGYFMLDPTASDAAERTRRALARGLKGICLFPAMHHFHVWDSRCLPVYEAARSAGAAVFTHFGILKMGVRDMLGLPSRFDMRFSNPLDLHGVAKEFPEVPFVMPHFGCGFLREALMVGDQCGNVCVDTSSSNAWVRTMPEPLPLADVFRAALRVFGVERILFGTDSTFFPRGWRRDLFEAQIEIARQVGLEASQAARLFGGNLARILRL
jgi:predicted TIM-barrel fold metal-dependent hydrolase